MIFSVNIKLTPRTVEVWLEIYGSALNRIKMVGLAQPGIGYQ